MDGDMTGGDIMVNSEDNYNSSQYTTNENHYSSSSAYSDRIEYETSVRLETPTSNGIASRAYDQDDVPGYATITSRLRQHDPPPYLSHKGESTSRQSLDNDENSEKSDKSPEDDLNIHRSRDEEDKIEVLDTLLDDTNKELEINGNPPGAGWTVLGAASLVSLAGKGKGDGSTSSSIAEKNSKILEQFEDKPRDKDECLVDCLYYTTTCCECTIL